MLLHLHAGKQLVEVGGDDLLERDETIGVGDPEPSGQRVRDLHPGEEFALVRGSRTTTARLSDRSDT